MLVNNIFLTIIVCWMVLSCGRAPHGNSRALRDEARALGMVLVDHGDKQLLKMVVCKVQKDQLLEGTVLADEKICRNAFVDRAGNDYYFNELKPRGLRLPLLTRGYLKLGSLMLIPVALGALVGWKAKPLAKKLKLIITTTDNTGDVKLRLDRGADNSQAVEDAKAAQEQALANPSTNTKFGAAGGAIVAIATYDQLGRWWGKGERLTAAHWNDIFRLHVSFEAEAKLLENTSDIDHILATIAAELDIAVNPALRQAEAAHD